MKTRCPLCTCDVPSDRQHWCECGQAMDQRCYEAHDDWCAAHGTDAWIGTLER